VPLKTNISKNISCIRSYYTASGCTKAGCLRPEPLEHPEVSCHAKLRTRVGYPTRLPPMLLEAIHNTITPPNSLPIHSPFRLKLVSNLNKIDNFCISGAYVPLSSTTNIYTRYSAPNSSLLRNLNETNSFDFPQQGFCESPSQPPGL